LKLNIEVNSGAAYVMSFAGVIIYALVIKAPFTEFWVGVASLYGWHTGRRLWRQLKIGTLEMTDGGANGDTPAEQK
jgi:hypothetical protein